MEANCKDSSKIRWNLNVKIRSNRCKGWLDWSVGLNEVDDEDDEDVEDVNLEVLNCLDNDGKSDDSIKESNIKLSRAWQYSWHLKPKFIYLFIIIYYIL